MNGLSAIDLKWLQSQFPNLSNLAPLNSGGQKQVFSAEHIVDGPVVLKIIHPHQDLETTRREILAVTQLSAHRVPQILEVAPLATPLGHCVWFREKRISGQTVRSLLSGGPLETRKLLKMGLQTLEVLTASESLRIVHRDIKPDNLICDLNGDTWVIDFGLARHLDLNSQTATAAVFGKFTTGYAPPEQFHNHKYEIDARCDLFSLGVTLYECATGANPFTLGARDHLEVFKRIQGPPLPRLNLSFPSAGKFADMVAAMTQPRRDHRPPSAKETHEWMKQICQTESI